MNHSYSKILALVYFKNQCGKYDLNELCSILGFTQVQLDELLSDLFERKLLEYKDYEMCISEEGKKYLEQRHASSHEYNSNDMKRSVINKENAISFEDIYIPKELKKKI